MSRTHSALLALLALGVLAGHAASASEADCQEARERARYVSENFVREIREKMVPLYEGMIENLRAHDYSADEKRFLREYAAAYIRCGRPINPARCTPELAEFLRSNWRRGAELQRVKVEELRRTLPATGSTIAGFRVTRTYDYVLDVAGLYGQVRAQVNLANASMADEPVKEAILGAFQFTEHVGQRKPDLAIFYDTDAGEKSFQRTLHAGLTPEIGGEYVRQFARHASARACQP